MHGYRSSPFRMILYHILAILSGGMLYLLSFWSLRFYVFASLTPSKLSDSHYVLVKLTEGRWYLERTILITTKGGASSSSLGTQIDQEGKENLLEHQNSQRLLLMEHRCGRYFFSESLGTFIPAPSIPKSLVPSLYDKALRLESVGARGTLDLEEPELSSRLLTYGSNQMTIPVPSIPHLMLKEAVHPFYVFQYTSILIWAVCDQYYAYSVCIALISAFSIISSAIETHRNSRRLADLAKSEQIVEALRGGVFILIPSMDLVPGDVVSISPGLLPCDMVLMRGECIVDENMLTGESVPVRKVSYSPHSEGLGYSPEKNTNCTLFGGTLVAQSRAPRGQRTLGLVVRTRFYSSKGQLLRSILFPRSQPRRFVNDSIQFIAFMLIICVVIFSIAAINLKKAGATDLKVFIRFLDMVTIAVPPALPACLTIALVFSIGRLKKKEVFVTSPDRIAMAGQLDVIAFDKTGTLTEIGLDLHRILPASRGAFGPESRGGFTSPSPSSSSAQGPIPPPSSFPIDDEGDIEAPPHSATPQPLPSNLPICPIEIQELLACCHGLAKMNDGSLVGDPLDQRLFQSTGWELVDLDNDQDGEDEQEEEEMAALRSLAGAPQVKAKAHQGALKLIHVKTFITPYGAQHNPSDPSRASWSILKRYEFSAALQRNAVVVQSPLYSSGGPGGKVYVFVKGSPEAIKGLVDPLSVPQDFDLVLEKYARQGLRVLALARGSDQSSYVTSPHDAVQWSQDQAEKAFSLSFVGLVVMANPLRVDSAHVVAHLKRAGIRVSMCTGDHVRTAVSVSHQCNIASDDKPTLLVDVDASSSELGGGISLSVLYPDGSTSHATRSEAIASVLSGEMECACTGKGFDLMLDTLDPELTFAILSRGSVFARMSPDNKRDLMELMGGGMDSLAHKGEKRDQGGLHSTGRVSVD